MAKSNLNLKLYYSKKQAILIDNQNQAKQRETNGPMKTPFFCSKNINTIYVFLEICNVRKYICDKFLWFSDLKNVKTVQKLLFQITSFLAQSSLVEYKNSKDLLLKPLDFKLKKNWFDIFY